MRYQVPQFIEVEDKIFGPFTFKQFAYLIGGAGICFILYRFLPLFLSIFLIPLAAAFSLALAFYKVNDRPFVKVLENAFYYLLSTKLYLWKKEAFRETAAPVNMPTAQTPLAVPTVSQNKLKELAWSLDVHEAVREGEERTKQP